MSHNFPRIRSAIYRQPWMITEDGLDLICSISERHAAMDSPELRDEILRLEKSAAAEFVARDKAFHARIVSDGRGNLIDNKFYDVRDGVGILRLFGPIFPRANLITRMSGATALETWSQDFDECLADEDVNGMILLVDSPGGAVSMGNEMASKVFAARAQEKPIVTLVEGCCASLAYLIGSQADAVYCTEASMVGSIGVVMAIEDDTRQSENDGIKRTVLKTGKNKAIGVGPITDEQVQVLKGMMNDYFERFKSAVTRARPEIDIESVSDGSMWIGEKSVQAKLCDGVSTLEKLIEQLSVIP